MRAALSTLLESDNRSIAGAPDTAVRAPLSASDRLTQSRERLRQAIRDNSTPPGKATNPPARHSAMAMLEDLKAMPGASIVIEAVCSWWAQHPLRIAGMLAADAAKIIVQPMAQRNPLGLMVVQEASPVEVRRASRGPHAIDQRRLEMQDHVAPLGDPYPCSQHPHVSNRAQRGTPATNRFG